jgi:hypothetical protein
MRGLPSVIPAKAGIQKFFDFLDSGSPQLQPADPSVGGIASLPGMTADLFNGLRIQDTKMAAI